MDASDVIKLDAPWYFGEISRERANELLVDQQLGSYLIRQSNSRSGFALTVKEVNTVKRYLISYDRASKKLRFGENLYNSFEDLLAYYSKCKTLTFRLSQPAPKPDYLALHTYYSELDSDLCFSRGAQVRFICQKDQWILCQAENGLRGWAPLTYLAPYSVELADQLTGRTDWSNISYCRMSNLIPLPAAAKVTRARTPSGFLRGHLTIQVDDVLQIEKFLVNGFCHVWREADGATGIVPLNCIKIESHLPQVASSC